MLTTKAQVENSPRASLYSAEAEEAVLGCVMINPDALSDVTAVIQASDMYLHKHRWVMEAFCSLAILGSPIDILTVANALEKSGKLEELGGTAYLTRLMCVVPTSLHAEAYAKIVSEFSIRRKLTDSATRIAKLAYDTDNDLDDCLNSADETMRAVRGKNSKTETKTAAQAASKYFDDMRDLLANANSVGITTGLKDVDAALGMMMRGDMVTIAGTAGSGKTSLMLQVALKEAELGKRVGVFSLEMKNKALFDRLVSIKTGIPVERLRVGQVSDSEMPLWLDAVGKVSALPIHFDDERGIGPNLLLSKILRLPQLDLVVVDYLQLMSADGNGKSRYEQVSHISRQMKIIAGKVDAPILCGAQLSRDMFRRGGKPQLNDLRDSGAIEQDSDVVMFTYWGDASKPSERQIIIGKNRQGRTHPGVDVFYHGPTTQFKDAERRTLGGR